MGQVACRAHVTGRLRDVHFLLGVDELTLRKRRHTRSGRLETSVNSLANHLSLGRARILALVFLGWYLMVPPLNIYLNNPKSFRG